MGEEEQGVLPRLEPASDTESRGVPVRSAGQTAKRNESLLGEERLITRGCALRGQDAVLGSCWPILCRAWEHGTS